MKYKGKRNCIKCGRWRSSVDYRRHFSKRDNRPYIKGTCVPCIKKESEIIRRNNGIPPISVKYNYLINEIKNLEWTNKKIAEVAKVDVRRVYDWLHYREHIGLNAADNLCIFLGLNLNDYL